MSNQVTKIFVVILLLSFAIGVFGGNLVHAQSPQVPQLIRLHILANSESLVDQRVKLTVRDELLAVLNSLLIRVGSMAEAEELIRANLSLLTQTVNEALKNAGVDYDAHLQFGLFNFPAKYYGVRTLPAGRYTALNVTLGAGEGRNWWCIVFPAMCFTAGVCEEVKEPEERPALELRCKLVEWIASFLAWCRS